MTQDTAKLKQIRESLKAALNNKENSMWTNRCITEALTALDAIIDAQGVWQSMDTAPKDGQEILLRLTSRKTKQHMVGRWLKDEGFFADWCGEGIGYSPHNEFTGWMHLPTGEATKPVSLIDCAMALQGNERIKLGASLQAIAKTVLDAAGVPYVD